MVKKAGEEERKAFLNYCINQNIKDNVYLNMLWPK